METIQQDYKSQPFYNPQGVEPCKITKHNTPNRVKSGIYRKIPSTGDHVQNQTNYPNMIIEFNSEHNVGKHPTQKPVALLEYLIKTYTSEGEMVLDNCMGSGSTGVACVNTNRGFIGIELDKKYFEMAKSRIDEVISKK